MVYVTKILNCIFCTFLNVCLGHFDKIDCVLLMLKTNKIILLFMLCFFFIGLQTVDA